LTRDDFSTILRHVILTSID